jgi:hypothetical protein
LYHRVNIGVVKIVHRRDGVTVYGEDAQRSRRYESSRSGIEEIHAKHRPRGIDRPLAFVETEAGRRFVDLQTIGVVPEGAEAAIPRVAPDWDHGEPDPRGAKRIDGLPHRVPDAFGKKSDHGGVEARDRCAVIVELLDPHEVPGPRMGVGRRQYESVRPYARGLDDTIGGRPVERDGDDTQVGDD